MRREVHQYASFVHGALAVLHLLGIVYNVRRRNKTDIVLHACGVAFAVRSTAHHVKES